MERGDLVAAVEQVVRRLQRQGLSRADAEDCAHDALLALLIRQADPDAEPVSAVGAWLSVTAHRKLVDRLRRAGREQRALAHPGAAVPAAPDPAEVVTDRALAGWLARAVEELPEKTRQVCRSVADGLSVEDIAARSGLTRRSVHSHLTRARRVLRHLAAGGLAGALAGTLAGTLVRWVRHTGTAAATAPVALAAAAAIGVALLPHDASLPHTVQPPAAAHSSTPPDRAVVPTRAQQPDPADTAPPPRFATPPPPAVPVPVEHIARTAESEDRQAASVPTTPATEATPAGTLATGALSTGTAALPRTDAGAPLADTGATGIDTAAGPAQRATEPNLLPDTGARMVPSPALADPARQLPEQPGTTVGSTPT